MAVPSYILPLFGASQAAPTLSSLECKECVTTYLLVTSVGRPSWAANMIDLHPREYVGSIYINIRLKKNFIKIQVSPTPVTTSATQRPTPPAV